jgi:hypothetical protein
MDFSKIANLLRNMGPDDEVWLSVVSFFEYISSQFSFEEIHIISEFMGELPNKSHKYSFSSLLIILFVNKNKLTKRDLFERFHDSEYATDQEIEDFMRMGNILENPDRTRKYAVCITGLYRLGPHGVAASCIYSL